MPPRLHVDEPPGRLAEGAEFALSAAAARHVQVLRLQPGMPLVLFDGHGGEWAATVQRMGRSQVDVRVGVHESVERELALAVTLAMGMPANDRMDGLVEKCTELGAAGFAPLSCERSVLRLDGERAARKVAHWASVASSACEQSGRTRVPAFEPVCALPAWLDRLPDAAPHGAPALRWILSFRDAEPLAARIAQHRQALTAPGASLCVLSGPEGGLSEAEERAARAKGFEPVGLGSRVLRADTAPMAVLAVLGQMLG